MPADPFFRIEMLPALHGDCLLVEYGDSSRSRRLLIDGGPIATYKHLEARLDALPAGDRRFELVVMSHVDTDHVEGIVRLLANQPLPIRVIDLWFNGWSHLSPGGRVLGGKQGEFLSALIVRRFQQGQWNGAFDGQAVVVPDDGPLPERTLAGDLRLTLLSPTPATLDRMREAWRTDLGTNVTPGDLDAAWQQLAQRKAYLPGQGLLGTTPELDALLERQLKVDRAAANGSSIAFLAEFEAAGKSCLFLADAYHEVVTASIRRLLQQRAQDVLKVDAVKVAHHGSAGNISDELLALIDSPRFLISTNGSRFRHPDAEAMQRIIARSRHQPPTLCFNYASKTTRPWGAADRQARLAYRAEYNAVPNTPYRIEL
ncbi:MAG: hypothetical protein H6942_16070 [Candidatus Accumulibacter sp.]|uniref:ComEC/Rec2 family competence protein n=1 Tax=Accumulibacter sp. TaxID=2053492 RepID=UPI001A08E3F1|nr:hypothetical protein [Accumulibacter sp.]MBE2257803.1 hypothetical protein [Paracoccaceae bacterium]MCB1943899.1 hypothetical protein [Accumulibacter sp.]MCP5250019.1 hypothetical protein [Accumulibacter sp.]